jgi:hypothetical protein
MYACVHGDNDSIDDIIVDVLPIPLVLHLFLSIENCFFISSSFAT